MLVLRKNLWRFETVIPFEDAFQEAYLKFLQVREKYRGKVTNPRWFMSIYKRTLSNLVTDFANCASRQRRQVCFADLQDVNSEIPYQDLLRGEDSFAELELVLEEAPEHVRQVLSLLSAPDTAMLGVLAQSWGRLGKRKQDGNQFLCQMLGYDHTEVDLVYATKKYLEER